MVLLNALTIATLQPTGQIVLCLTLTLVISGTHILRRHPQVLPALRSRQWRRLMTVE